MAGSTRRAMFAGIGAIALAVPAVAAAAVDPMAAWREGFGGWVDDVRVWPLMVRASELGFRPDQLTGIFPGGGMPSLSLETDKGGTVRIYHEHVLWVHERTGESLSFDARAEAMLFGVV